MAAWFGMSRNEDDSVSNYRKFALERSSSFCCIIRSFRMKHKPFHVFCFSEIRESSWDKNKIYLGSQEDREEITIAELRNYNK